MNDLWISVFATFSLYNYTHGYRQDTSLTVISFY